MPAEHEAAGSRPGRLAGKVALITGAASGIGFACAELFAREGAMVVATDLADGTAVADRLGESGTFLAHDVTSEPAWAALIASALDRHGRIDVLVQSAGIAIGGTIEEATLADFRLIQQVNLDSVFIGMQAVIPAMKPSGGGSIVNISSIAGIVGEARLPAYNASKGGVRLLTKSAALHLARTRTGIRVNSVHPGYIWTPMVQRAVARQPDPEAGLRHLESLHPVGRLGTAEDVAYGVLYLASDESRFVTGSELVIDGGYTAQ